MKEKISLFIALSFLLCLTIYKKSMIETSMTNDTTEVSSLIENQASITAINENDDLEKYNVLNEDCLKDQTETDQLDFSDAFKYYRNCNNKIFKWNNIEYTTLLKTEVNYDNNNMKEQKELDLVSN